MIFAGLHIRSFLLLRCLPSDNAVILGDRLPQASLNALHLLFLRFFSRGSRCQAGPQKTTRKIVLDIVSEEM
jgi:hypothetical protein